MKDFLGKEFHPTEMYKLINMLIKRGDKNFSVREFYNETPQVLFYNDDGRQIGDAICHAGSYGHEEGLLEIMGLDITEEKDGDSVKGWLTAEEVIEHLDAALTEVV